MDAISVMGWVGLLAAAAAISFCILWLVGRVSLRAAARDDGPRRAPEARFWFQDDTMFDHDAGALPPSSGQSICWADLRDWLASRFDDLPETLTDLPANSPVSRSGSDTADTARLELRRQDHGTRITLCDPPHACPAERHQMLDAQSRLETTTEVLHSAPYPIWRTTPDGALMWKNPACSAAFDPISQAIIRPEPGEATISRFNHTPQGGGRPVWFEVHSTHHGNSILHHANDITKIVTAETMQKDFVQTLTKTFAYLTTGLAVFDRGRKLAMFNPALVDLTSLPAQFLSARPDLTAFFDHLRNSNVMPEPRSYASWRSQINDVIESAEGGLYQETWSLPNDVTYRVTGRPHPDGAVAFLFEDISADVMLARSFRTQVDLRQSALDGLPAAVIVMGQDGVLSFCNAAATRLLRIDPDSCFADMSASDLVRACERVLPDPHAWQDIEAGLRGRASSGAITRLIATTSGPCITCQVEPLPGGARMLTLHEHEVAVADIPASVG